MRAIVDPLPRGVHLGNFFHIDGTVPVIAVDSRGVRVAQRAVADPAEVGAVVLILRAFLDSSDPLPAGPGGERSARRPGSRLRVVP